MKKKIFAALTVMFALSLALTVYAINQTSTTAAAKSAGCCDKKDSCPMKNKQAQAENASSCDKADCCRKAESCPMRAGGEKTSEGTNCCCQSGACPMKKSDRKQTVSADEKSAPTVSVAVN